MAGIGCFGFLEDSVQIFAQLKEIGMSQIYFAIVFADEQDESSKIITKICGK